MDPSPLLVKRMSKCKSEKDRENARVGNDIALKRVCERERESERECVRLQQALLISS